MSNGIQGGVTKQLVRAALRRLYERDGIDAVQNLLASVDAVSVDHVDPSHWGSVLDSCPAPAKGQMAAHAGTVNRPTPPSVVDSLTKMGLDMNDNAADAKALNAGIQGDLKSVIEGGETLADGLANASKTLFARQANRAAAK